MKTFIKKTFWYIPYKNKIFYTLLGPFIRICKRNIVLFDNEVFVNEVTAAKTCTKSNTPNFNILHDQWTLFLKMNTCVYLPRPYMKTINERSSGKATRYTLLDTLFIKKNKSRGNIGIFLFQNIQLLMKSIWFEKKFTWILNVVKKAEVRFGLDHITI